MKNTRLWITLPLLVLAVYWSFHSLMPSVSDRDIERTYGFSTDRALEHVKEISRKPHAVGFPAHSEVRDYVVQALEAMGLEVSLQQGYTAGDWGNFSKATNIVSRIEGSGEGKALLLLSHYDSNPHSSLGASDAGSGVATILEGIRAFLSKNKKPKNDIIILISDAEELGLNGADLFANRHPWTSEVGLILNFEARGSGGPSYMFMETNRGNEKLIESFISADPKYPVSNSLAYSIYKLLPNDTDLTVFREDRDIEGFNFAFIDDHFDYHSVRDSYERLDRNSLTHQGSYLMPLLHYLSEADLGQMKSLNDHVYFNIPVFKMVSYPFDWIWPMWYLALAFLGGLLVFGFRNQTLKIKGVFLGFVPLLITLLINGVIGYFAWAVITTAYPGYKDILHGFPYNGHAYILALAFLSLSVCFWIYRSFRSTSLPELLIGPLFIWLAICWGVGEYLPGASFFIIPVFALLASLLLLLYQKEPDPLLLLFLGLPAVFIFAPFTSMFPVALGLKMAITTTLITTLCFALLLPLVAQYKRKRTLGTLAFAGFLISLFTAHLQSGFTRDRAKPTSLVYLLNTDDKQSMWATYEKEISDWTRGIMGDDIREQGPGENNVPGSKYNTRYTFWARTGAKQIPGPVVTIEKDTTLGDTRFLEVGIFPQRPVNRLEVFTGDTPILKASVNGVELSPYYLKERRNNRLFTHYISDNDSTYLEVSLPRGKELNLTLYEASNDLLKNPSFDIPPRPEENIPMPFVLNDAVITVKSIRH